MNFGIRVIFTLELCTNGISASQTFTRIGDPSGELQSMMETLRVGARPLTQ